ncbi:MAG: glycine cleavage system transcriptional activator [marine bacterium B5-7]|nr:MAG: glycine cleavage system transcriptional activator [marine bacterium B5-7]
MRRRLPSLNGLKSFEAAARFLSFTRAAESLFVSQAAVSHQIKSLEEQLGVSLFRRSVRSLELTDAGRRLYPKVQQAFDLMEEGVRALKARTDRQQLTISVLPSFASGWLVRRLARFTNAYPGIQVRIDPSSRLSNFLTDDIDVGIRYGLGDYQELVSEHLMDEDLFPVCSRNLAQTLDTPEDLAGVTLLHDDGHGQWNTWLKAQGIDSFDVTHGPVYTDSNMVIQAAIEGHGVALARSGLSRDALVDGRLVQPFDFSMPSKFAYYLVYPKEYAQRSDVQAFSDWMKEEIARDSESPIDVGDLDPVVV